MQGRSRDYRGTFVSPVSSVLDFASDWAVLAFAVWTLIAYAGMATGAAATLLVSLWLGMLPLIGAALVMIRRRVHGRSAPPHREHAEAAYRLHKPLVAASVASGLAAALLVGAKAMVPWPIIWAPAAVAVALAVALGGLRGRAESGAAARTDVIADVVAAGVGVVFAVMSLFISNGNADDAFYINRATATAQLNRIPVQDVLFTNEAMPPISGAGLPVDALHALQGAVARLVGVHAATIAYLVTPPLATFLATWALWRLLRAWAPRRVLLCFALGCQYWLWSAATDLSPGSFFLARIWQGKVIFVAWIVPTLYLLLTRYVSRQDALGTVMLVGGALASIGLTGSATFVAPLVFAGAGLALIARREWRPLTVVAGAGAIPLVIGFAVTQKYPLADTFAVHLHANRWIFGQVFGPAMLAAIGAAALWSAPWLARAGAAGRVVTGVAVTTVVLLAPGVMPGLSDAFGLTDTLRRLLWIVPLPAVVGLLASVPLDRTAATAAALLVAGLLVVVGNPVWANLSGETTWTSRPELKTNLDRLSQARVIAGHYRGPGTVLAHKNLMRAIAIETVQPKAVSPRSYYAQLTTEPRRRTRQRLVLTRFATRGDTPVPASMIRQSLADLNVGLVCLDPERTGLIREAGLADVYRPAFRVGDTQCFRRTS